MRNLTVASLAAAAVVAVASGSSCAVNDADKKDCGSLSTTQASCEAAGCCWSPAGEGSSTPWCYYGSTSTSGYTLSSWTETATGFSGQLSLIGKGTSTYGPDLTSLSLEVFLESADSVRIKITDSQKSRWEVPQSIVSRPVITTKPDSASLKYKFIHTESPFTFQVVRISDGAVVFNMDKPFTFKDQYIEFSSSTDATATTYGVGESARLTQALQNGHTYTLWAADIAAYTKDVNLYGSYPYYVQMVNGAAHGAMLMNSNGMDVLVNQGSITFKTLGGIIDLYVFAGSTPQEVVQQYTSIVGRPAMMPYWSLGFHNCKYGYKNLQEVEEVVAGYKSAGIPLDTQWMDIDYMQNYRDFTTDASLFPTDKVAAFVAQLHADGQHFTPIIDPGIMVYSGYPAYEDGMKDGLFVKDISGGYYLGQVWPGPTYFPDFLHPKSQDWWTKNIQSFYDMVQNDGLWIDMNEVSNFCNDDGKGQVCKNSRPNGCPAPGASQTDCCLECSTVDPTNPLDLPAYKIKNYRGNLGTKTMAPSAYHYGNVSVYNAHNLYGLTEQIATNKALTTVRNKRPFVLTRSSFLSTGHWSAKWTGDNAATWDDLKASIVGIVDMNMFGVPMIGADICGFLFDTTEELCARWISVGAFYPFSRNHNTLGAAPQELYLWSSVTTAAKNALGLRYRILPYLYTLFYLANTQGAMVARSLWVNFPNDATTLHTDRQFMLGSAVLITPVLDQGAVSVNGYFPKAIWYSLTDSSVIDASTGGKYVNLATPLTAINVHAKGGSVVPMQSSAMTTEAARKTPFSLSVFACSMGGAEGQLFWDDGEQISLSSYLHVTFNAENIKGSEGSLASVPVVVDRTALTVSPPLDSVVVRGISLALPSSATINGNAISADNIVFDKTAGTIVFTGLNVDLTAPFALEWK